MGGLVSPHDLPYLVGYLIITMAMAAIAALAVGRISNWRFPRSTVVFAGLLIPIALIGFAAYILAFYPDAPSPNDGKAMAAAGLMFVAIVTYPFTAASSFMVARRATR